MSVVHRYINLPVPYQLCSNVFVTYRWCPVDRCSLRYLLGDAFGRLVMLSLDTSKDNGLVLLPIGEVSSAPFNLCKIAEFTWPFKCIDVSCYYVDLSHDTNTLSRVAHG